MKSTTLSCVLLVLAAGHSALAQSSEQRVPTISAGRGNDSSWTAVTMARNGSWGVATSRWLSEAVATAIRNCQTMDRGNSDCGAEIKTVKSGWSMALHCGQYRIIASGETLQDAKAAVHERKLEMKYLHSIKLPACQFVVLIEPSGHPRNRFVVSGY